MGKEIADWTGKCGWCFWNHDLPTCQYAKMICNTANNCGDWRLKKLTEAEKAKDAAIQKAAHVRDKSKKMKK